MIKYRYMVKWTKDSQWVFWDGQLDDDADPPVSVMIIKTGWTYNWENFQKVRLRG